MEDVGNAEVHEIVTLNQGTNLIESIVDCQAIGLIPCVVAGEDLIIRLTNGGNILCPNGRRKAKSSAIITASDPSVLGDAELVQAIFRTSLLGLNGDTIDADEFVISLHFVANAQVPTNQDDDFDFFNTDRNAFFDIQTTDQEAGLSFTEKDVGKSTKCKRPPSHRRSKRKGRKGKMGGKKRSRRGKEKNRGKK